MPFIVVFAHRKMLFSALVGGIVGGIELAGFEQVEIQEIGAK